jgi:hypothetical protein
MGLLSNVTRAFRENGLSISRAEIGTNGDRAVGSFYVTDASGYEANPQAIDEVKKGMGGSVVVVNKSPGWTPKTSKTPSVGSVSRNSSGSIDEEKPRLSPGSLFWSQLKRLSSNFSSIRS